MTDATRTQTNTPDAPERHSSAIGKPIAPGSCCGGPAPGGADACCARDAEAKSAGGAGCGCGGAPAAAPPAPATKKAACCG